MRRQDCELNTLSDWGWGGGGRVEILEKWELEWYADILKFVWWHEQEKFDQTDLLAAPSIIYIYIGLG